MRIQRILAPAAAVMVGTFGWGHAGVVENANNSGPGSLREAIADALPGETITFHRSLDGATINLTDGQLTIDKDLTIDASGLMIPVTIDAGQATVVQRVLEITPGVSVVIDTVTISGGDTADEGDSIPAGDGGGIHNAGTLTLRNSTVSHNTTGDGGAHEDYGAVGGCGGGIYNSGEMVIEGSAISHNTTGRGGDGIGDEGGYWGGSYPYYHDPDDDEGGYGAPGGLGAGICNLGTLTIRNSTISHNGTGRGGDGLDAEDEGAPGQRGGTGGPGGGIHNAGDLTIENATVFGNTTGDGGEGDGDAGAGGPGGGIHHSAGTLSIVRSTISGNTTGESVSFGGSGAGVFTDGGTLEMRNATLSENTTGFGGFRGGSAAGIYNAGGTVRIENVTVSGNATGPGLSYPGGIGGIYNSTGSLAIVNSIVAGNTAALGEPDLENWSGTVTFAENNLIGGDPMLAPLGFYGGTTRTMQPLAGSPAIDAGVAAGSTPPTDQRGLPRVTGAGPDLGAFETGNGTGYAAWAAMHIPAGQDDTFAGDADGDGLSNGVEYGCGADGGPVFAMGSEGARISFGYRPEAEAELIWKVVRSTDLQTFTEILRIEASVPGMSPDDQLSAVLNGYVLVDAVPPVGRAFYRLEVELVTP